MTSLQWPHLPDVRTSLSHARGVKVLCPLVPLQLALSEEHWTLVGAAYWHLRLSPALTTGMLFPFKSQSVLLICSVSSFSDPAISAWALICRAILPNPSRSSWTRISWGLVPRSPSALPASSLPGAAGPTCPAARWLGRLHVKGTAIWWLGGEREESFGFLIALRCVQEHLSPEKRLLNRVLQEGLVSAIAC